MNALASLRRVLCLESEAIASIANRLDESFAQAVDWLRSCEGRVVTCGLGKSGHIARKTAGTLSSTGTPSHFLHAAEAAHGDLGMVTAKDVVLMYSYGGESDELNLLFPAIHSLGARTILLTGRPESTAGRQANLVLNVAVEKEACPNNLAPTASTTVMLAVSDALAVTVMEQRGFTREDFGKLHPSGIIGKRLLLTAGDIMRTGADLPLVSPDADMHEVLKTITNAGAGAALVVDPSSALLGFISDGDLRRHFLHHERPMDSTARDLMVASATTIPPDLLAVEALEMLQNLPRKIGEMPVIQDGRVVGLLMLKDLLRSGIV